ncbi:TPA: hypothetical protein N0F65_006628 [Lagenidium giganteum]|uniref:Lysosomal thioesterase PPT2 n=1 Tax=Lagenidium giganteum TaxID=4803 RepID=A0AAV2ZCB2_9STRA|nr:TPA: hypothetical protein N0F65_006628 [Lagenidium giganteum]
MLMKQDPTPVPNGNNTTAKLPVFFFHGVTANASSAYLYQKNLTAEGRAVVALDFCPDLCSVSGLNNQVQMAIKQVRDTVAKDSRFANGYIFIGHSQGGSIARAVIEEMDDHKVDTFVSLAGAQNGIFYGPQPTDQIPMRAFVQRLGPQLIPAEILNFSSYTDKDYTGKFQRDFSQMVIAATALQPKLAVVNLPRSPVHDEWAKTNEYLPVINNINPCSDDKCKANQARRKSNFLKLRAAHFFASPGDDVIAPWQTSILGQYNDVADNDAIEKDFASFKVMSVKETLEYKEDTYGLKTLDERRGLFLHTVENVAHSCWVADSTPLGSTELDMDHATPAVAKDSPKAAAAYSAPSNSASVASTATTQGSPAPAVLNGAPSFDVYGDKTKPVDPSHCK